MSTRQRILISLAATAALALGLARCVGSERGAAPADDATKPLAPVDPAVGAAPAASNSVGPSATLTAGDEAPAKHAAAAAPEPIVDAGPRANPTATALQQTDSVDRELLADVERLTKKSPPPSVGELIALHHRGSSRAELAQFIEKAFGTDIALRTSCLRWLEQVHPSGRVNTTGAPGLSTTADPHIKQPTRRSPAP